MLQQIRNLIQQMRVQKPLVPKQISNDFSHKKIHRRINTEIDDHTNSKFYKPQIKKTMRTSSKPKFLDVYSKYNQNPANTVKQSITQRKNFKIIPPKQTYAVKQLKTEPDQIFLKREQKKDSSKKKIPTTKQSIQGQSRYEFQGVAGKGTFGVVYFGRDKQTNQKIAVKKVFQDKKYKNRQHLILQMLSHPNVLQMRDSFLTYEGQEQYLNIIMDYYSDNLYQVIKKKQITPMNMKLYAYQIFRALNYLSILSIAHRDMKPQNILVDMTKNKAIICDFGSAKKLVKAEPNLAYICSRCYRAPELIFGATNYNTQIDMWSMGCILVEMVNGYPPFLADSQIDQLIEIIKVLGTPSQEDVQEMNPKYDMKEYSKFPKIKATPWKNLLKTKDPLLIDLITKTLQYSPLKRITPGQALAHDYFDDLRDQARFFEMKQKLKIVPDLFNLSQNQLNFILQQSRTKITKSLIPKWVKLPGSKFGPNISLTSKSNTMSNMMTKPSSSQGSRINTGISYIGKKITISTQNK